MYLKKLLPILTVFIILSCNDDEVNSESFIPPIEQPTQSQIFTFDKNISILDTHYYKGPDGNDDLGEAESFFKKTWTFYEDPSIKSIELKEDSIIINEELRVSKFKSTLDQNDLYVQDGTRKLLLGRIDKITNTFYLFKNFQSYAVVDSENGSSSSCKNSDFGKITKDNIFPRIINKPEDLTQNGAYVFWNNVEYRFIKK